MATRSGSVDPGLLIWLLEHGGIGLAELSAALEQSSGVAGLSGVASGDLKAVVAAAASGSAAAALAIDVYVHRLRREIAAMAAALNGLDALVFTGGVGEHSAPVRSRAAGGLGFLGVQVDPAANEAADPDQADGPVTAAGGQVAVLVLKAREDLEMARQARQLLAA
jgi:acetate kinase